MPHMRKGNLDQDFPIMISLIYCSKCLDLNFTQRAVLAITPVSCPPAHKSIVDSFLLPD